MLYTYPESLPPGHDLGCEVMNENITLPIDGLGCGFCEETTSGALPFPPIRKQTRDNGRALLVSEDSVVE